MGYGEWEDHFFSMKDSCAERFHQWLLQKGAEEYSQDFPSCMEIYLDFVYCYMHDDIITLQNISAPYIEEFFTDFVLRKVMVEPHEYTHWPPALKLFYAFLHDQSPPVDTVFPSNVYSCTQPYVCQSVREFLT